MFIETIKSEGLAHLSYLIGSDGEAAVIDPRRDCTTYIDRAASKGCRITHVFETHRNEDLLSGAPILRGQTGAKVLHGPNAAGDVAYADTAREGDEFEIGRIRLRVLETPGHTDDSLSYTLCDLDEPEKVVAVFTGDALFVGDVGRCDFYPSRAEEVAGLLFDSLRKIEALGPQAVVYPAHGAGSVCGSGMADRDFSTIGHEMANNPKLQIEDRDEFIRLKTAEEHDYPPYFERMERLNLTGAAPMAAPAAPEPLPVESVAEWSGDAEIVDVRSVAAFAGAHVPGSLSLPVSTVSSFASWFVDPEKELLLVADTEQQAKNATLQLARMGFDRVCGYLAATLAAWAASGQTFSALPAVSADEVRSRIKAADASWMLLDVRKPEEWASSRIREAHHHYLADLPERLGSLDRNGRYTVMCDSGVRAVIAASVLRRAGVDHVDFFLGSMSAWKSRDFPTTSDA